MSNPSGPFSRLRGKFRQNSTEPAPPEGRGLVRSSEGNGAAGPTVRGASAAPAPAGSPGGRVAMRARARSTTLLYFRLATPYSVTTYCTQVGGGWSPRCREPAGARSWSGAPPPCPGSCGAGRVPGTLASFPGPLPEPTSGAPSLPDLHGCCRRCRSSCRGPMLSAFSLAGRGRCSIGIVDGRPAWSFGRCSGHRSPSRSPSGRRRAGPGCPARAGRPRPSR